MSDENGKDEKPEKLNNDGLPAGGIVTNEQMVAANLKRKKAALDAAESAEVIPPEVGSQEWADSLKKPEAIAELEELELDADGKVDVLRERLVAHYATK